MDDKIISALLHAIISKAEDTDLSGLYKDEPSEKDGDDRVDAVSFGYDKDKDGEDEDQDDKLLKAVLKSIC